jgi:hypothetical protein
MATKKELKEEPIEKHLWKENNMFRKAICKKYIR